MICLTKMFIGMLLDAPCMMHKTVSLTYATGFSKIRGTFLSCSAKTAPFKCSKDRGAKRSLDSKGLGLSQQENLAVEAGQISQVGTHLLCLLQTYSYERTDWNG